jgi:hypothetical protein
MDIKGKPDRLPDGTPCYQGFCNMVSKLLMITKTTIVKSAYIYFTKFFAESIFFIFVE